jgi:methanogen homoaconitase small subunit
MARIWRFGADVNTDQIVPGRYAPYMTSEAELRKYPFIEARPEFATTVQPGDVIVAGSNFGCGSSREYAPLALRMVGIGAIVAPSFARIFFRNALNLGIPLWEADLQWLEDGAEVQLDVENGVLHTAQRSVQLPRPPSWMQEVWRAGGIVPYYREHGHFPGEAAR